MIDPHDLERLVDRHVRRLPMPSAPATLLPRVMAAVQAWAQRPWYSRAWITWPLAWQAVSISLLMATLASAALWLPTASAVVGGALSPFVSVATADVPQIVRGVDVARSVTEALWHTTVQPLLPFVFVLVALMCAACAMCLLALNRAVFGRALQS